MDVVTTPQPAAPSFSDLQLRRELLSALDALGYEEPTPIQLEAVPPLLAGRDVLGQAATGTGKTAAFALPVLNRLAAAPRPERQPTALILVPTRELAVQVAEATHRYGRELAARVVAVYGGQPIGRQIRALEEGADVVVATPGRALDHLGRGTLALSGVRTVILDEADEMLDMGFAEDIDAILDAAPAQRQTVLFSATIPARLNAIVKAHLHDPVRIRIKADRQAGEAPRVRQVAYLVNRPAKPSALGRLLDIEAPTAALVFCRTREEVDALAEQLSLRGYRAEALHGGMTQDQRDRVMSRLRAGTADLIVATDVAARGLDIEQLTHVVNYDVPSAPEAYVHRIGRVGRAGREGVAVTLLEPRQHRLLKTIERATGSKIAVEKVPTVADLRARRLDLTRAALAETLLDDDLDRYQGVVDTLSDEYDLMSITLAAVKLAHEATSPAADEEEIPQPAAPPPGERVKLFVGLGRAAHVRPQDLVGAIANESSLSGRQIGAIEIAHKFSTVEVPAAAADEVITALRGTTIKGRKPHVDRFRPRT